MADNKKYLDLNGLGYAVRKMDAKKADIESPVFTGTPKIGDKNIAVEQPILKLSKSQVFQTIPDPSQTVELLTLTDEQALLFSPTLKTLLIDVGEFLGDGVINDPTNELKSFVLNFTIMYRSLQIGPDEFIDEYDGIGFTPKMGGTNPDGFKQYAFQYVPSQGLFAFTSIDTNQINGKADINNPNFTGTPTINSTAIATTADIPDVSNFISNASKVDGQIWIQNNSNATTSEIRLLNPNGNVNFNAGNQIIFESGKNITFRPGAGYQALYNGEEIAVKKDIIDHLTATSEDITDEDGVPGVKTTLSVTSGPLTDFTIMDGHKGDRGISLLHISTSPWANTHMTPDGKVHNMCMKESEVLAEALVDKLYLGDIIEYNGFLYQIAYLGDPFSMSLSGQGTKVVDVYADSIGNIKGPQGIQGIQGEQGPQGPKGDPGEGYFIVTDDDYARIADFVEEKSYHSYQRPDASEPIRPNIFYDFGPQYTLEITFEAPQSIYRSNEYMFQFESPSDRPTTLIMPESVKWCYDPVIEAGKTYQVSVLNDLAVICGA